MPSFVTLVARARTSCPTGAAALEEPRRIVVAVAPARAIDEHRVLRSELRAPATLAGGLRRRAKPGAAVLLDRRRNRVVGRSLRPGPRRVREDVHLGDAGGLDEPKRVRERGLVLGRKPDDDVGRQVEVGEWLEPAQVGLRGVAAAHRAQHAVVARLERHMQVAGHERSLTEGAHQLGVDVVDLDRRQA